MLKRSLEHAQKQIAIQKSFNQRNKNNNNNDTAAASADDDNNKNNKKNNDAPQSKAQQIFNSDTVILGEAKFRNLCFASTLNALNFDCKYLLLICMWFLNRFGQHEVHCASQTINGGGDSGGDSCVNASIIGDNDQRIAARETRQTWKQTGINETSKIDRKTNRNRETANTKAAASIHCHSFPQETLKQQCSKYNNKPYILQQQQQ